MNAKLSSQTILGFVLCLLLALPAPAFAQKRWLRPAVFMGCGIVIAATVLFRGSNAKKNEPPQVGEIVPADLSLGDWTKKFASPSGLEAWNRKTEWKFSEANLSRLLAGEDFILEYDSPIWHMGQPVNRIQFSKAATGFGPGLGLRSVRPRRMLAEFEKKIAENPKDSLLIFNVGARHAMDYFFENPDMPVHYVNQHYGREMDFGNDAYKKFSRLKGDDTTQRAFRNEALANVVGIQMQLQKAAAANPRLRDVPSLLAKPPAASRVIFFGISHAASDLAAVHQLPSASGLKASGIRAVTMVIESVENRDLPYTAEEMENKLDYLSFVRREAPEKLAQFERGAPEAYRWLLEGKVQLNVAEFALLEKARAYAAAGIAVTLRGVN